MESYTCMSVLYAPTLKEDPVDAEIASHRLLTRGAMIRKVAAGVYSFLPLGSIVLRKIEDIVRDEMNAVGSQEILMPALQPSELWHESGRWDDYGPELMRLSDRHDRGFCLGPTHEELVTSIMRNELRSYRELPKSVFQIQVKFRDEIRPRFGLLRGREFIMKDAYSFHSSQESLQEHYDDMARAYGNICVRCGLEYRPVEADSGQIGGKVTIEFMALADAGEAELVYCDCGFASNTEVAQGKACPTGYLADHQEKIHTPGVSTIAALAAFLNVDESATVKALVGIDENESPYLLFVPGDHEVNEIKISHVVKGFRLADDAELTRFGLVKGYIGPVGIPEGIHCIADESLKSLERWVVGANEPDYHLVGARLGEDFEILEWADLITAQSGDRCPDCGAPLRIARGIEVSQVFQLGEKYSRAMNATYTDESGEDRPFLMGCYGVGVSRTMAAIVEQHNDENGMIWPISVCPGEVIVIPLSVGDATVFPAAETIASELAARGIQTVLDDRDERAGVKFADADLIGWPYQIICGKRGVTEGVAEIKDRATGEKISVPIDEVVAKAIELVIEAHAALGNLIEE